jgi:hypothetical protein
MAGMALYTRQRPPRDGWLIPGALCFLALAVLFALGMVVIPGGTGTGTVTEPAAAASGVPPTAPVPTAAAPSATPSRTPSPSPTPSRVKADGVLVKSALTGLCLSVQGGAAAPDGAAVEQDPCGADPVQRWRVTPGNGAVAIVNLATGKCLDVNAASGDDGARVQQWSCLGVPNQQWRPQPLPGDPAGIQLTAVHSGKCLDLPAQQTGPGSALQQWSCTGGPNQRWLVTP